MMNVFKKILFTCLAIGSIGPCALHAQPYNLQQFMQRTRAFLVNPENQVEQIKILRNMQAHLLPEGIKRRCELILDAIDAIATGKDEATLTEGKESFNEATQFSEINEMLNAAAKNPRHRKTLVGIWEQLKEDVDGFLVQRNQEIGLVEQKTRTVVELGVERPEVISVEQEIKQPSVKEEPEMLKPEPQLPFEQVPQEEQRQYESSLLKQILEAKARLKPVVLKEEKAEIRRNLEAYVAGETDQPGLTEKQWQWFEEHSPQTRTDIDELRYQHLVPKKMNDYVAGITQEPGLTEEEWNWAGRQKHPITREYIEKLKNPTLEDVQRLKEALEGSRMPENEPVE